MNISFVQVKVLKKTVKRKGDADFIRVKNRKKTLLSCNNSAKFQQIPHFAT